MILLCVRWYLSDPGPIEDIRRATRKHYSAENKIRIVLEGLRGEESIAAVCRREAWRQKRHACQSVARLSKSGFVARTAIAES